MMLGGCSDDSADDDADPGRTTGVDTEWYDELDAAVAGAGEVGSVPVLERGDCPIDTPEVDGEELDDSPDVGVSSVGESGHRLICSWSPPATDLVVTQFEDAAELELARDEIGQVGTQDNGANVQVTEAITVGERDFYVRQTTFPTNDAHVDYDAWYLDDDNTGFVLLSVEAADERNLIETYDAQQAAQDLADLLSDS